MENRSGEIHVTTEEARSGTTSHGVRWVLGISLLAAIVLLSILWMTSAAMHSDAEDEAGVTAAERRETANTDGVVSHNPDGATESPATPDPKVPAVQN
ncbi:MAG: hypothetical protein RLZZ08_613 [Pseudomonadota bacterium]|jgi:hypothetical protein